MAERIRVLVSAFSCRPGRGSEPGAGWQWTRAAGQVAEVSLLTERGNEPYLEPALAAEPELAVRPVYVDLPDRLAGLSEEDRRIRFRYAAWQAAMRRAVPGLAEQVGPHVVHHLTFSADWQPVGLPEVPGAGFVWGPVGGTAPLPWRTAGWLDARGRAGELGRTALGVAGRRAFGDPAARRADVVLCQNADVARRFARSARGEVLLEPNVALQRAELTTATGVERRERTAVFAGRLEDWKGVRLAVATLTHLTDWRLVVVGEGPAQAGAQEFAARLGLADRVAFRGLLPRPQALGELASASALLLPSMHDACGWVVAEALALGTPAVVLDVGGPPLLVERAGTDAGFAVPVTRDPTAALAAALRAVRPAEATTAFDADRLPALLERVYASAARAAR